MSTSDALTWLTKVGLALLAATAAWGDESSGDSSPPSSPSPETTFVSGTIGSHALTTLSNESLRLGDLAGEIVVVNFWASWCKPCQKEVSELNDVHAWLAPRGGRVVAVSIDRDRQRAARFSERQGMAMTVCHDGPDGLAEDLDIASVPFTLVLDRQGRVAHTIAGQIDAAALMDVLTHLGVAPELAEADAKENPR